MNKKIDLVPRTSTDRESSETKKFQMPQNREVDLINKWKEVDIGKTLKINPIFIAAVQYPLFFFLSFFFTKSK